MGLGVELWFSIFITRGGIPQLWHGNSWYENWSRGEGRRQTLGLRSSCDRAFASAILSWVQQQ